MMVVRRIWPQAFSLELPKHWSSSEEDGVVSCCDQEGGSGALQVSLFKRPPRSPVTIDLAREVTLKFADRMGWKLSNGSISGQRTSSGINTEFEVADGPDYWRVSHLMSADRMALITYTCSLEDSTLEAEMIEKIIGSFEWESDAA